MSNRRPYAGALVLVTTFALLLQGCFAEPTPVVKPSAAPHSASVPATASPTPLPATVPPTDTPAFDPTPEPTPTPVPYSAKGFTTHDYAATNGKQIYYFSKDGIHCMNKSGSGDKLTCIVYFEYFLAFNTHGLFYVAPDSQEENGESVMVYDPATQTATPIETNVDNDLGNNVVTSGNRIYMIDDTDHSHIICYDMTKGMLTDITGIPSEFSESEVYLNVENGKIYVDCSNDIGWAEYLITGNKAKEHATRNLDDPVPTEETPGPDYYNSFYETGDGGKFRLDNQTDTLAIWTGTEYSDLDIPNIYNVIVSGNKLYVLSYEHKDNWPDDDFEDGDPIPPITTGSPYALYRVSSDGSYETLQKGVDKTPHFDESGDGLVCDVIGGWHFTFWKSEYGDSAWIAGILLKKKVG